MDYCTISHRDTGKRLGMGGMLGRSKARAIILSRKRSDDGSPFLPWEWMVTGWIGTGGDEDEIEFQMSADEFAYEGG